MNNSILVFGMPRSGTTWIGKLFDSHPDTLYRHEPDSVHRLDIPLYPEREDALRYRGELDRFVAMLPFMRSPEVVGKQPLFPKSYQSSGALIAYRASVLAAKATSRVRRHFPCVYRPAAAGSDGARLVWKSIESSGRLGVCVDALPGARAIHVMRHPCGYIASVLRGWSERRFVKQKSDDYGHWQLRKLLATTVGKDHEIDIGDIGQLTLAERMAWCWVLTQTKIIADVADSGRVLTVRYEDVCTEPLAMTRRMFEFVGLGWHPQTEAFVQASISGGNTRYYSVFKDSRAAAERWRAELAPDVVARTRRILDNSRLSRYYAESAKEPVAMSSAAP